MINSAVLKWTSPISDTQALAVQEVLECLMNVDICLRSENIEDVIDPDDVTKTIIKVIEAFSFSHKNLEDSFENDGLREAAKMKRKLLEAEVMAEADN
jgi:hypothetical protein